MKKSWVFFKLRMLQFRYDKTALVFVYIVPILLLIGIGLPVTKNEETVYSIAILDEVSSEQSDQKIEELNRLRNISIHQISSSEIATTRKRIEEGKQDGLLVIASNEQSKANNLPQELLFELIIANDIDAIALGYLKNELSDKRLKPVNLMVNSVGNEPKDNKENNYLRTLLPGVIAMTLFVVGLQGFGLVLAQERSMGLFKNLKTIDRSPSSFLVGLCLSRLVACYLSVASILVAAYFVFDIGLHIDYLMLFLMVSLGALVCLGLGAGISALSKNVQTYMGISNSIQIPFIVLSGVFMSVESFPDWMRWLSNTIPLTHLHQLLEAVFFDAYSIMDVSTYYLEVFILLVWLLGTVVMTRVFFKW